MSRSLSTPRLVLRAWVEDDATAALKIYGDPEVTRWLSPAMDRVGDREAMRLLLQQWIAEDVRVLSPAGHWAIVRREDQTVIGGARLLPLPPGNEDLEVGWQLRPDAWGHGYASEAMKALASWAFSEHIAEVFAVVRSSNLRGTATVRRNGMQWVGETGKYFGLTLQVFRLLRADFDPAAAEAPRPTIIDD